MDRSTRNLFLVAVVILVAITGAAVILLEGGSPGETAAPSGTTPAVGVIVAVDSAGLGSVSGFTLRLDGGQQLTFDLRELENGVQFPPGHLAEHQATAQPVRVWYRDDGGTLLAIRLEDASP